MLHTLSFGPKEKQMKPWQLLSVLMSAVILLTGCATSAIHEAALKGDIGQLQNYVDKGGDIEERSDKNWVSGLYHYAGKTPLHMAVEGNQPDAVRYLLGKGADIEAKTSQGETPLLLSAKAGNMTLFDLLLRQGADRFTVDNGKRTALLLALAGLAKHPVKAYEVAGELISRRADVNTRDRWENTPLHLAAKHNLETVARLLIHNGADINTRNIYGETPLFASQRSPYLSQHNRQKSFEYLVTLKQDFRIQNSRGRTLLHRTCHPPHVRMLLNKGVPANKQDEDGHTPPFFALSHCKPEAVSIYLEQGFDLKNTGAKGRTVVLAALDNRNFRDDMVSFVIAKGADVTQQDQEGRSAIHRAAAHSPELLDLIITHGGNINAQTRAGATPLHVATSTIIDRIVSRDFHNARDLNIRAYAHLLDKADIDINATDINGCTPLHRAVNSNSLKKIQLLLEHGAKVNIKESRGHTPMDMAVLKKNKPMMALFQKYGGNATVDSDSSYSVLCAYP